MLKSSDNSDSDSFQERARSDSIDCHLHEPILKSVHPSQSPPPRVPGGDLGTIDLTGVLTSESENESCSGSQVISAAFREPEETHPQSSDHSASSSESNPDPVISKYSV